MKKTFFYVVFLLMVTITTSCVLLNPVYDNLKLSASEVTVEEGDKATFEIISGSGDYLITVVDTRIGVATLSGTTVVVKGVKEGETVITVFDRVSHQRIAVGVKVSSYVSLFIDPIAVSTAQEFRSSYKDRGGEIEIVSPNEEFYRPNSYCTFNRGTEKEYQYYHYQGGNAYRQYVMLFVKLNSYYTLESITKWLTRKYSFEYRNERGESFYSALENTLPRKAIFYHDKEKNQISITFENPTFFE